MKRKNLGTIIAALTLLIIIIALVLISLNGRKATTQRDVNTRNINTLIELNKQSSARFKLLHSEYEDLQEQLKYLINHPPKNGADGADGSSIRGDRGPSGPRGAPGPAGIGITGSVGASAYSVWLSAGNTGSITDFLNSLHGDDASPPRELQLRCNKNKLQNEWRYIGDSAWKPLDKVVECAV